MNTDTGRLYDLHEMYGGEERAAARLDELAATEFSGFVAGGQVYSDPLDALEADVERAEFERAFAAGDAVPVSGRVVQTLRVGERELKRRRRRAVRDARRRNRT